MSNAEEIRMRNKPCPCGSGKRFKHCCAGKPMESAKRQMPSKQVIITAVALVGLAVYGAAQLIPSSASPESPTAATQVADAPTPGQPAERVNRGMADDPQPRPAAWYYDQPNDRHWHEPHDHWHPGAPPPASVRSQQSMMEAASRTTVTRTDTQSTMPNEFPEGQAPPHKFYDEAGNRHWWEPHNHWHPGAPPEDGE